MRFVREGWPANTPANVMDLKKLSDSLTVVNGCLLYGNRVVIPTSLKQGVLQILHQGHTSMQRMKQLARSAVYWPKMDQDINDTCRQCTACAQHKKKPEKPASHPWMMPEKLWSRIHVDHAINFLGHNWLVITDAYSKYP